MSKQIVLHGVISFAILFFMAVLITYAQGPDLPKLGRTGHLTTPERKPKLLEQRQLSPGVTETLLEIPAEADTYITSNNATENFGSTDGLFLGYSKGILNYGAERIFLQFDIASSIPANANITQADLRLYLNTSNPSNDLPMNVIVRRTASAWGENTITWDTEALWGDIRANANIANTPGWYQWDITSLVLDWRRGNYPNYGLEIIGDEHVQQRERIFYARETETIFYPHLLITYNTAPIDNQPPVVTVDDLAEYTLSRDFEVSWQGSDLGEPPSGIAYYDVQYQVDEDDWQPWLTEVTFNQAQVTGAEGDRKYGFRARGVDNAGNVEPFGGVEAETTINITHPTATVNPLPFITGTKDFTVSWISTDNAPETGIYCYDVRYRYEAGVWNPWQDCVTATSALFQATADGRYAFEARAVDHLGNREAFTGNAEAITIVDSEAPFVVVKYIYLPVVFRSK